MRFVPSGVRRRLATRCPRILRDGILWYAPQQRRPVRKLRGSGDDNSLLRGLGLGAGHLLLVDPSRGEWRTTWTSDCARGRPRLEERQHIAGSTADSVGPDRAGLATLYDAPRDRTRRGNGALLECLAANMAFNPEWRPARRAGPTQKEAVQRQRAGPGQQTTCRRCGGSLDGTAAASLRHMPWCGPPSWRDRVRPTK